MKCKWCEEAAARKQGRIWLCAKHYRFQQMRSKSTQSGKERPQYDQLELLASALIGFRCPSCAVKMNWLGVDGRKSVVTLQHDRSGAFRLICLSCNTRHQHYEEDTFYSRNDNVHPCRSCGEVKSKSSFYADRSRPLGIKSYCKECSHGKHSEWAAKNRPKLREQSRAYRARSR